MNPKVILSTALILTAIVSFSQDEIPINKETGLVSVNNVVKLSDTSTSIKQIKEQADKFIKSNSSFGASPNPYKFSKKNKDKMPNFIASKTLDEDSIVIYDIVINIEYAHTAQGVVVTRNGDMFQVKLKLYMKKGRFKYDFTNMTHNYAFIDQVKGLSGGKFENEKPERSTDLLSNKKREWTEMKKDVIILVRNIAREFEKSFSLTPNSKQFDF